MLKLISSSRKKGLLKSNLNLFLIISSLLVVVVCVAITLLAYAQAGSPLNLRYSSIEGPFDRGDWFRIFLLPLFMIFSFVTSIRLSSKLLDIQKPNFVTAILISQLTLMILCLVVSLQYLNYSQI